jgi:hypothetical protein
LSDNRHSNPDLEEEPTTTTQATTELEAAELVAAEQRPILAGMLRVAAELVDGRGLPEPVSVQASHQFGIEFDIATHEQLRPWMDLFGFEFGPWRTMPFEWNGIMHTLTTATGLWCGTQIYVRCCEPVDGTAARVRQERR